MLQNRTAMFRMKCAIAHTKLCRPECKSNQSGGCLLCLPGRQSMCCQQALLIIFAAVHTALKYSQDSPLFAAWLSLGVFSLFLLLALLTTPHLPLDPLIGAILAKWLPCAVLLSCFVSCSLHVAGVLLHSTDIIGLSLTIALLLLGLCMEVGTMVLVLLGAISIVTAPVALVYLSYPGNRCLQLLTWTELVCWLHTVALVLMLVVSKGLELKAKAYEAADAYRLETNHLQQRCNLALDALSILGHEISTPVQSLKLGIEALWELTLAEMYMDVIQDMALCVGQILSNMNSVLHSHQLGHGKVELYALKFSMPQMLMRSCSITRQQARAKQVSLHWVVSPEACSKVLLVADVERLIQVMVNLLVSAITRSPEGGTVMIRAIVSADIAPLLAGKKPSQTGQLIMQVEDSGPVITHETRDELFQKFAQPGAGKLATFRGSYLGLSICWKIVVESMGGNMYIDQMGTPGTGTLFVVKVPVAVVASDEIVHAHDLLDKPSHIFGLNSPDLTTSSSSSSSISTSSTPLALDLQKLPENFAESVPSECLTGSSSGASECSEDPGMQLSSVSSKILVADECSKILVADDCPISCRMLVHMLQGLGYGTADYCSDGKQAIEMFVRRHASQQGRYEIVLTDFFTGEITGDVLVQLLRSFKVPAGAQPLLIIGMIADGNVTADTWKGVDVVLHKPFIHTALLDALMGHQPLSVESPVEHSCGSEPKSGSALSPNPNPSPSIMRLHLNCAVLCPHPCNPQV
mmetsp:Transcript_101827/g.175778  ORF Transcript_101827/g.175778 Transcript_101827/m.175778 type:complete len:749 (-) Transcript_101827:1611-3857(-)